MNNRIVIPFNNWSRERLKIGIKCATSRTKNYGQVGDYFYVNDTKYKLNLIIKLPLWFIRKYLYQSEGCYSSMEFEKAWCEIHPIKGFAPYQFVSYHHFIECEEDAIKRNGDVE